MPSDVPSLTPSDCVTGRGRWDARERGGGTWVGHPLSDKEEGSQGLAIALTRPTHPRRGPFKPPFLTLGLRQKTYFVFKLTYL